MKTTLLKNNYICHITIYRSILIQLIHLQEFSHYITYLNLSKTIKLIFRTMKILFLPLTHGKINLIASHYSFKLFSSNTCLMVSSTAKKVMLSFSIFYCMSFNSLKTYPKILLSKSSTKRFRTSFQAIARVFFHSKHKIGSH